MTRMEDHSKLRSSNTIESIKKTGWLVRKSLRNGSVILIDHVELQTWPYASGPLCPTEMAEGMAGDPYQRRTCKLGSVSHP